MEIMGLCFQGMPLFNQFICYVISYSFTCFVYIFWSSVSQIYFLFIIMLSNFKLLYVVKWLLAEANAAFLLKFSISEYI